jgi:hypothetical protein
VSASLPVENAAEPGEAKPIILVSYPKIVLLYPTFFAAMLAGILTLALGEQSQHAQTIGVVFLGLLTVNLVVLSFDFPRTTSLTLFFVGVVLLLSTMLISIYYPAFLPALTDIIRKIDPRANATFYFCFVALLALIYVGVMINIRFDYWEVRPNELLHHHGFLSNLERHSAPGMRINKEIDDVFEYMLLRSGRLIIHPTNEPRAIVLDNVLNIDAKEMALTQMLGSLQVSVRNDKIV